MLRYILWELSNGMQIVRSTLIMMSYFVKYRQVNFYTLLGEDLSYLRIGIANKKKCYKKRLKILVPNLKGQSPFLDIKWKVIIKHVLLKCLSRKEHFRGRPLISLFGPFNKNIIVWRYCLEHHFGIFFL